MPENIDIVLDTKAKVVCRLDGILFFDGDFQAKLDVASVDSSDVDESTIKLVPLDSAEL